MSSVEPTGWRETVTEEQAAVLLTCVAKHRSWFGVDTPFVQGGHLCATDGFVAVRIPTELVAPNDSQVPAVDVAFELGGEVKWYEIPAVPKQPPEAPQRCLDCRGDGGTFCQCQYCDGGFHECEACGGKGTVIAKADETWVVKLGRDQYLKPPVVRQLLEMGVRVVGTVDGKVGPAVFEAAGLYGRAALANPDRVDRSFTIVAEPLTASKES